MNLKFKFGCENIDWNKVSEILKTVGMAYYEGELHRKAFENSYVVVFVFDEDRLIGLGRALSDGAYQAALYDIAVLPEYQGNNIGTEIMNRILKKVQQFNVILYASPGKEIFYKKLKFRMLKTGMALFTNPVKMKEREIIE